MIVFLLLVRILNEETCGRDTYSSYEGGGTEAGITLDAANEEISQQTPFLEDKRFLHARVCFAANATTDQRVELVDEHRHILTKGYVNNGYDRYCLFFEHQENHTYNFIGINCPGCGPGDEITFYREIIANDDVLTITDTKTGGITVSYDKPYDWSIDVYPTCWNTIRYFTYWYLTGAIFFLIIFGLVVGLKKTEEVIKRD